MARSVERTELILRTLTEGLGNSTDPWSDGGYGFTVNPHSAHSGGDEPRTLISLGSAAHSLDHLNSAVAR